VLLFTEATQVTLHFPHTEISCWGKTHQTDGRVQAV